MRHLLKFLHTIGAIGLMGAMACLLVLLRFLPDPSSLTEYARMRMAMGGIAEWVFLPSFALTLIAGLLAFALNRAFHNAGWALVKLASSLLIFEWSFFAVLGPMQNEAALGARALAGNADPALLGRTLDAEWSSLCVLLAVAVANVVLGIWRPRFVRRSSSQRRGKEPQSTTRETKSAPTSNPQEGVPSKEGDSTGGDAL